MGFQFSQISSYPKKVKLAIMTLIAGWLLHFLFLYRYFPDLSVYRQLVAGVVICVFVTMIKRWARMLCIFFNIAIAVIYLILGMLFFISKSVFAGNGVYLLLAACCLAAFAVSTFYLLTPECSQFFKAFGRT
jgi:hypothetical protein